MGVPKFFRYISERYPCLSELVRDNQIPEFDNLYLDMNGIIHNCSHPDDKNITFRITEEQIFADIFNYLDVLFKIVQPRKLLFMAVDGVAPRAKMNQQRGRRFRSAKEAEESEELARKSGISLPNEARFDSNCITPGTAFMVRLQDALHYFVQTRISTNPAWQQCKIILSGHETPGEGEHKIMEYIRFMKSKSDYDPNTRHCLYGLDADLIILGLCTHELHFSLLREEVKFGRNQRKTSVNDTPFYLLHLGLLREYLELEFDPLKRLIQFEFDMDKIIDDWVFMGFMVGNDFIPHLPNLHINHDALPILMQTYINILPKLDGYINNNGQLNLLRLQSFLDELSKFDRKCFSDINGDLRYYSSRKSVAKDEQTFGDLASGTLGNLDDDLAGLIKDTEDMFMDDILSDDVDEELYHATENEEFHMHKRHYYMNKLNYPEMTEDILAEQTECYIRALQWILYYYYRGVRSWGWYYPHHYAPFISDLKNISDLEINFELGKPFLPFEQLLAVLPAASRSHLPSAYWDLMTDPQSPIIDYYPDSFETDMNGKLHEWEAVVLIPFIDETRLLNAMKLCESKLSNEERARNCHGPMLQYEYTDESIGPIRGCYGFNDLANNFTQLTKIWISEVKLPDSKIAYGPPSGLLTDVYFPGFPTMKHLKYTGKIENVHVKVFDQVARKESMVLCIEGGDTSTLNAQKIAEELVDKVIYINWPHLSEVKVISVYSLTECYTKNSTKQIVDDYFHRLAKYVQSHYTSRLAIDFGSIDILLEVAPLAHREYVYINQGRLQLKSKWSESRIHYPIQGIVKDIAVKRPDHPETKNVVDIFKPSSQIFLINTIYYGCEGIVIDPSTIYKSGRIKVSITAHPEPNFDRAKMIQQDSAGRYSSSFSCAQSLTISTGVFNRVTGSVYIIPGNKRQISHNERKVNIGLELKFPKKGEEVIGYTKKIGNMYCYSEKAVDLVNEYLTAYPIVLELLSKPQNNSDIYFESDLYSDKVGHSSVLDEIRQFIKGKTTGFTRQAANNSLEQETIKEIVRAVKELENKPMKYIKLQVKPHLLYCPILNIATSSPDPEATFQLFDRVVVVKDNFMVSVGMKGTIIGIVTMSDPNPIRQQNIHKIDTFVEILFDHPFDAGSTNEAVMEKRIFKIPETALLNLSYGEIKFSTNTSKQGIEKSTIVERPKTSNIDQSVVRPNRKLDKNVPVKSKDYVPQMCRSKSDQRIKETSTSSEVSAETLKKLLGITEQMDPSPMDNHITGKPINILDMFKVPAPQPEQSKPNIINLPKPPPNWRNNNVSKKSTVPSIPPQPFFSFRQSTGPVTIHYPTPHQQRLPAASNNIQPFIPPRQACRRSNQWPSSNQMMVGSTPPRNRPNGPQNLSNNVMSPAGHGAFIPLQAARRQITKRQPSSVNGAAVTVSRKSTVVEEIDDKLIEVKTGGNIDRDSIKLNKKKVRKERPNQPRIGARFNVSLGEE